MRQVVRVAGRLRAPVCVERDPALVTFLSDNYQFALRSVLARGVESRNVLLLVVVVLHAALLDVVLLFPSLDKHRQVQHLSVRQNSLHWVVRSSSG